MTAYNKLTQWSLKKVNGQLSDKFSCVFVMFDFFRNVYR